MNRRDALVRVSLGVLGMLAGADRGWAVEAFKRTMIVYRSPSCGCCGAWVKHVRASGFAVTEINVEDVTKYKQKFGVPLDLASCHTAIVETYAFEGHVPADLIERFLRAKPKDAKGLAVAGMPVGSPGMEMGARKDAYDVVLFKNGGGRSVYARR